MTMNSPKFKALLVATALAGSSLTMNVAADAVPG